MAMLKINIEGIIANATPPLKQSITCLDSAQKIISSINIPSDFSQASAIKGTITTINSSKAKIKDLSKWVTEAVRKYNEAENKNKSILDSLFGGAISDRINAVNATIPGTKKTLSGIANAASNVIDRATNIFKTGAKVAKKIEPNIKATKSKICKGFKFIAKTAYKGSKRVVRSLKTGAKVSKMYFNAAAEKIKYNIKATKSKISKGFKFIINKVTDKAKEIVKRSGTLALKSMIEINRVGTKVVKSYISARNKLMAAKKIVEKEIVKQTKSVVADAVNTVMSFGKGVCKLGEALLDAGCILGTAAITSVAAVSVVPAVCRHDNIELDMMKSSIANMWKSTMSFVAEQHVENAYKEFYKNNFIGKWLDENAHSPFKSDGIVSKTTTGIGYATGVITLSVLTGGTITPFITGFATFGQSAESYWSNAKNTSKKGKDWRTFENGAKGIGYASVLGAATGLASYAGGKIASMDWTKGAKVAANTATSQANTFIKILTNATASKKAFSKALGEAWNNEGGWRGVAANFVVAFLGEVSLSETVKKIKDISSTSEVTVNADGTVASGTGNTSISGGTVNTEGTAVSGTENTSISGGTVNTEGAAASGTGNTSTSGGTVNTEGAAASGTGNTSTSGETTKNGSDESAHTAEIDNKAPKSTANTENTTPKTSKAKKIIEKTEEKAKEKNIEATIKEGGKDKGKKKSKKAKEKNIEDAIKKERPIII